MIVVFLLLVGNARAFIDGDLFGFKVRPVDDFMITYE